MWTRLQRVWPPFWTNKHLTKRNILFKFINNSSSQNQENHNREGGLDTRNFDDFTAPFTLSFYLFYFIFFLIEKIHQTLQTLFYRPLKNLEVRQNYFAARRIFNSLLGIWFSRWNTVSRVWYIPWVWTRLVKATVKWHTLWNSSQFILFRPWLKKSGKAHKFRCVPSLWRKF